MNKEKENDSNSTIYIYPLKSGGDKKRYIIKKDRLKGNGGGWGGWLKGLKSI